MIHEVLQILRGWGSLDTWIVVTSAIASMSCAIPGVYLLVRRQSMLGDTLSHTALPGIAIGFLAAYWLHSHGWLSQAGYANSRHLIIVISAMLVGVLASLLIETVQKVGHVEANAALGVVFTSMFAVGLLLVRRFADQVDLDPDCVLYGTIETTVIDVIGNTGIPRAVIVNGSVLAMNLLLTIIFFKELRVSAFDPAFATTMGISATAMHYALTAVTAATLVAAFESVGSILVIAMLVGPAATARLLTDGMTKTIILSLVVACLAAVLGHVSAITVPPMVFRRLGFPTVIDASTAGMTAVASGGLFLAAAFCGPRYGILSRLIRRLRLALQVAAEDILGQLYRAEESHSKAATASIAKLENRLAWLWLRWQGSVIRQENRWNLTRSGRLRAEKLVRAHRLWESYMAKHFEIPGDHLHETAERVEHFIDKDMRVELASELATPAVDPHGRAIPSEQDRNGE
jgi:manganese/zinc/iron transport system permease protein